MSQSAIATANANYLAAHAAFEEDFALSQVPNLDLKRAEEKAWEARSFAIAEDNREFELEYAY